MSLNFKGKVALVTGSSSGIGAATAIEFAKLGAKVVITGRNADKLRIVEKKCQECSPNQGKTVLVVVGDVTQDSDLTNLVNSTLEEFGQLDVLVNNAGAGEITSIFDPDVMPKYEKVMNTNLKSVFKLTHLAVPHLIKTKGNIVNISSVGGTKPIGIFSAYCMAKAALDMFTKCLALDLGPKGVRVNCVKPGSVPTDFGSAMGYPAEAEKAFYAKQLEIAPLRRVGSPEDISNLIVFLASPKSANMTGSLILSDSGVLWGPDEGLGNSPQ